MQANPGNHLIGGNEQILLVDDEAPIVKMIKRMLERSGGTIKKPIFPFPGGRRFHFTDPNVNEYAVWSE